MILVSYAPMRNILLGLVVLVLLSGSAEAVALRDIADHPNVLAIQELLDRGIVHGYPDGTFKPNRSINRAEFLKILMLSVFGEESFDVSSTACFFDFGTTVEWYYPHACTAKDFGIIDGYPDGTFRGENTVLLAEALKMSLEAWDVPLPQYVKEPENWYTPYIDSSIATGVFRNIPLAPDFPLTRGEAAELLVGLQQPLQTLDPDYVEDQVRTLSLQDLENVIQVIITHDPVCGNGKIEKGEECDDGNTENDDGCSEICIVVPQPVWHGALRIEQRSQSTISVVPGTEDVLLLSFDAIAGRQDVYITHLKFTAGVGSLESGKNYKLYYDNNGDGTAEKIVAEAVPQNDELSFSSMSILIRDGYYKRIELRGDVASSGTVSDFSVQFATSEPDYISGVDAKDGEDVSGIERDNISCQLQSICWIAVYTESARLIEVGTQGSLFVTEDTSPVQSRQLLAGELSDSLLGLKIRAIEEDIEITKLSIGGGTDSIDSLEIYEEGAVLPFAIARKSSCNSVVTGDYCADTDLVIQRDEEKNFFVRAQVNSDTDGGVSGDTVTLSLTSATTGNTALEARGKASLMDLDQNDGDSTSEGEIFIGREDAGANSTITGETHDVVLAKIAFINGLTTDSDNSPIPTGLTTFAGLQFGTESNSNSFNGLNDAIITSIIFNVSATNVEFDSSSFALYNPSNPGVTASCSGSTTTGVITVTCSSLDSSSINTVIGQSDSIELALQGDVTNPQINAGTSTLQAQLQGLGNRGSGPITWNDEETTFPWVDLDSSTVRSTLYRTN